MPNAHVEYACDSAGKLWQSPLTLGGVFCNASAMEIQYNSIALGAKTFPWHDTTLVLYS